jgi:hypothetical protein
LPPPTLVLSAAPTLSPSPLSASVVVCHPIPAILNVSTAG